MTTQYVMANIQIPIEIIDDDSFELMPEYISIQIENCLELPEKRNLTNVQSTLLEQIKEAIEKRRLQNEKVQLPLDKPAKKRPQNITFKRYTNASSRNTMRNYESETDESESSEDEDEYSDEDEEDEEEENILTAHSDINETDKDADSSQLQEVQEQEQEDGQSHVSLKEDEYLE
uniref:Uncharacterized protein n=1 Tax=viral metagenome TaxID=1070528 RepID=A0A6C0D2U6_9ZZZZ